MTHSVAALVRQRVYAQALGYEDLNDHEHLRRDPSSNSDMATADVTLDIRAPEEVMVVAMLSPAQNSWIRGNS